MQKLAAAAHKFMSLVTAISLIGTQTLATTAQAQIADAPAETFLNQVQADFRRLNHLVDTGVLTVDPVRTDTYAIQWRDGIRHVSIGGFCDSADLGQLCSPVPEAAGQPTTLVWDLRGKGGKLIEQVWIGVFADAEYVFEGGQLVGLENPGAITNQPASAVYMMIGVTNAGGSAKWVMWGLRSFDTADLGYSMLDWDWVMLKSGNGKFDGTTQLVIADATAIEYGLIAALIAVVIINGLTALGPGLNQKFDRVSAEVENAGVGSSTESDTDGDGIRDSLDNCPNDPNPDQADADGDGVGDVCDA